MAESSLVASFMSNIRVAEQRRGDIKAHVAALAVGERRLTSLLERYGVEVAARVQHSFPSNGHNENYLRTKAERAGHLL